jgi:hypothetical protein
MVDNDDRPKVSLLFAVAASNGAIFLKIQNSPGTSLPAVSVRCGTSLRYVHQVPKCPQNGPPGIGPCLLYTPIIDIKQLPTQELSEK